MSEPDLSDLGCMSGLCFTVYNSCFVVHIPRITHYALRITYHVPVLTFQGAIAYE